MKQRIDSGARALATGAPDQWKPILAHLRISPEATLVETREKDLGRLLVLDQSRVVKLVLHSADQAGSYRAQTLWGEYQILRAVDGLGGRAPVALDYVEVAPVQAMVMTRLEATPLGRIAPGLLQDTRIMLRLVSTVVTLARQGISHNDLTIDNILIDGEGRPSLVDFDQASRSGFVAAVLAGVMGLETGPFKVHGGILQVALMRVKARFPRVTRLVASIKRRWYHRLPKLPADADPRLISLLEAWTIAQKSNASSPQVLQAYYAIDFMGVHFPGERPWDKRWSVLKSITDFKGKKVLELGCNMGLLATHLLKEAGAATVVATDMDEHILSAARIVARVFNVEPTFVKTNFDSPEPWEDSLGKTAADIVFALNVLNWVQDKERFLRFLGRFPEVIFEGHDSADVETERLRGVGFAYVRLISTSERQRPILHGRKE